MKIKLFCKLCGNEYFVRSNYFVGRRSFCSPLCAQKAKIGQTGYWHGPHSKDLKERYSRERKGIKLSPDRLEKVKLGAKKRMKREYFNCLYCKKPWSEIPSRYYRNNKKRHFCSSKCAFAYKKEYMEPWEFHTWKGGKSFEPYGLEFNKDLREKTRKRDNYRCQECFRHQDELFDGKGRKYSLIVHHIDYDKKNNNSENLISLCRTCHAQTNFGRNDWEKYFKNKINV